ncbi:hypothetical protein EON67_04680 [archaeon]|nr:MAG: hypothetical protein EON67_04680 [archaeon]
MRWHAALRLWAPYTPLCARCVHWSVQALAPGQKRTWQVWEPFHYALLAGTAALWWAAQYRPNTNPRDWARDEAEERMRRREVRARVCSRCIRCGCARVRAPVPSCMHRRTCVSAHCSLAHPHPPRACCRRACLLSLA